MKKDVAYMLSGSLWDKILIFAIPLAITSILQQLFNVADVAVVGQFAGKEALAAVGSIAPVLNILLNLFIGMSLGSNVVIAHFIGAGNYTGVKRAVHTALIIAFFSGIFLIIIGQLFARPILELMETPPDVIDLSVLYFKILFCGMPFMLLYNFSSSIFRAQGNTKTPLIALIIAGVFNVGLNLLFVIVFKMSVAGVATATVISNVISACILLYFLSKNPNEFARFEFKELRIDKDVFKRILHIGLPAGLQGMVFSFSNIIIQSGINSLGSTVIAASSAAVNFEYFTFFVYAAFSQAAVTFVGQNYGGGKLDRCSMSVRWAVGLGFLATAIIGTVFVIFRYPLAGLFTPDPKVIEIAALRILLVVPFTLVNSVVEMLSGAMRGFGKSIVPAIICIVGICVVRIVWIYTTFRTNPTFENLMHSYPVSWGVTLVFIIAAYFIVSKMVRKKYEAEHGIA